MHIGSTIDTKLGVHKKKFLITQLYSIVLYHVCNENTQVLGILHRILTEV